MDLLLVSVAVILLLIGLIGCLVPFIPGPPLSYIAVLLLQFSSRRPFDEEFLVLWGAVTIAVTAIDYWFPIYGVKKLGGSKAGIRGATAGLIVGLFFYPPFGIIIGPLIGAVLGELITGQKSKHAFKSAIGSFIGLVAGTLMKLVVSVILSYYFIINLQP
jgi:uncharacterized protein